ncbi:BgTH12-07423 [Blumeria graminis f. sp. triticale]|nr:BgTH12-07423 [Blumeria graminis f. sp. triticale]
MVQSQVLLCWLVFLIFWVPSQGTTSNEIAEFVEATSAMTRLEIRVATSLKTLSGENYMTHIRRKPKLLLAIEPSNLILIPETFEFRDKKKSLSGTASSQLMIIAKKIEDLKLICFQQKLHKAFHDWGIVELCEGGSEKRYFDYLKRLFDKKALIAISLGDLKSAPIVEIGKFKCLRTHGACLSPRPKEQDVASILKSKEEHPDTLTASVPLSLSSTATSSVVVTITITSLSTLILSPNTSLLESSASVTSPIIDYKTKIFNDDINELDPPPSFELDPVAYEIYRSKLEAQRATSSSKSVKPVWWINHITTLTKSTTKTPKHHHTVTVTTTET